MSKVKSKSKSNLLTTITFGVLGLVVLFLVSPDNLVMNPDFQLAIITDDSSEKAYVINKGWDQAENVMITVVGNDELIIDDIDCLEGFEIIPFQDSKKLYLHLERMSVNLECSIYFSMNSSTISKIVVTSDDSSVSIKERSKDTLKISELTDLVRVLVVWLPALMILTIIFITFLKFFRY